MLDISKEVVDGMVEFEVRRHDRTISEFLGTFKQSVLFPDLFSVTPVKGEMQYLASEAEVIRFFMKL